MCSWRESCNRTNGNEMSRAKVCEANLTMEIAQLLLSLLHGWGIDPELDYVCEGKLGLLRPMVPVSFGVLSKGGYMSLLLPTCQLLKMDAVRQSIPSSLEADLPREMVELERATRLFTEQTHWELSTTVTTNHLLAIIALSNTLMSMNNASFVAEQERNRKLQRKVREAAQALLLAELGRIGTKGRKALVDAWAQFLPVFESEAKNQPANMQPSPPQPQSPQDGNGHDSNPTSTHEEEDEEEEEGAEELCIRKPSSMSELKRKETTAVVLLGVIGAEFGQDVGEGTKTRRSEDQRRKSSVVEGFGIGNNNLARLTSIALTRLLLTPPSQRFPAHTPLRRAAIDLIGRGFTVWEPYIDVSKVLLGLLELCCDADKLVPSMSYGLPLTPAADSCRTARHALTLIATARPAAFITTMAREVSFIAFISFYCR
ncbi:WD repeat-containing protein 7-like [Nilaparvata lugens]|uniref:WD repeat-containing protein 7-like n=1 Tax=Nilaparvata lugens TaxID=108931 RepID=UPI00193CAB1D|nr:WD repeat-containing protein 7-like [Nilaparvata lugens]